jgi:hypothetical protein
LVLADDSELGREELALLIYVVLLKEAFMSAHVLSKGARNAKYK